MKKKNIDMIYQKLDEDKDKIQIGSIVVPMTIISHILHSSGKHIFEKHGLTQAEMDILATLHISNGGLTASELSERLIFTSGGTSKVVKKLESKNLIYKKASEEDKRSYLLYLTEAGKQIIESGIPQAETHQKKFFKVLNDTEMEILEKAFKKILYALAEE